MESALTNFLIAIAAVEVGLMLFIIETKHRFKKFVRAMTLLLIMTTPLAQIFPLLIELKLSVYLFPPAYLLAIIGWLFATRKFIIGKDNWYEESVTKKAIRKTWLLLIGGFFVGTMILVSIAPYVSNWPK